MHIKTPHLLRCTAAMLVLLLTIGRPAAAPRQAGNDWQIENANVSASPAVSELIAGQWTERLPVKGRTLLEVRGTLKVEGDGGFGPIDLAEVKLLAGETGTPTTAELVAIGVGTVKCRYIPAQVAAGKPIEIRLGQDREFALERKTDADAVLFSARASTLDLCMAFELTGAPPPALLWRIAGRPIGLAVGTLAPIAPVESPTIGGAAAPPAETSDSFALPSTGRRMIASPLLWTAAGLTTVALAGALLIFRLRRRWLADRGASDRGSALDIPRVGSSHQPTTLTPVGHEAGPGRQHFHAALAALRLGEWTQANELFSKAIEAGLTPTYEAGAWSLRGDAMLNCDDLLGAASCFLRSLSCSAVTTESVLLSAGHLAAIYRELGFRRDAGKMDKVKLLASPFGSDLGPQRNELIARLASKFKHKRRARMLARINPFT